jgi:hypothetical protein
VARLPFGGDANIWLVPTEKALAWKHAEAREAFGDDRAAARDEKG